jgi:hypothetical protein
VCQNDWKKEPTLAAVSTAPAEYNEPEPELEREREHVLLLCHGVKGRKGARERGRVRAALGRCE